MSSLNGRNRQRGKEHERAIASRLGGKRVGILGHEDVSHEKFSIECKSLARFAGVKYLEQAERNAAHHKTAIAIVHIRGQRRDKDIVLMRLAAFEQITGV
jgi:hypothetical protein